MEQLTVFVDLGDARPRSSNPLRVTVSAPSFPIFCVTAISDWICDVAALSPLAICPPDIAVCADALWISVLKRASMERICFSTTSLRFRFTPVPMDLSSALVSATSFFSRVRSRYYVPTSLFWLANFSPPRHVHKKSSPCGLLLFPHMCSVRLRRLYMIRRTSITSPITT